MIDQKATYNRNCLFPITVMFATGNAIVFMYGDAGVCAARRPELARAFSGVQSVWNWIGHVCLTTGKARPRDSVGQQQRRGTSSRAGYTSNTPFQLPALEL